MSILAKPVGPGLFRKCPLCGRWFALVFQGARAHEIAERLKRYRCKHCGGEVEFAKRVPH